MVQIFANNDWTTLEYFSKRMGELEIVQKTASVNTSQSTNTGDPSQQSRLQNLFQNRSQYSVLVNPFTLLADAKNTSHSTSGLIQTFAPHFQFVPLQLFEFKNPLENNTLLVVFTFETNDKEFAAKGLICFERTTSTALSRSDQRQIVRLIRPDELDRAFRREEMAQAVFIKGQRPMALSRVAYYSDPVFMGLYMEDRKKPVSLLEARAAREKAKGKQSAHSPEDCGDDHSGK